MKFKRRWDFNENLKNQENLPKMKRILFKFAFLIILEEAFSLIRLTGSHLFKFFFIFHFRKETKNDLILQELTLL